MKQIQYSFKFKLYQKESKYHSLIIVITATTAATVRYRDCVFLCVFKKDFLVQSW